MSSLLQAGVEFFQKKKYAEASEVFIGLTKTQPDDARVWYYAALSRGLATQDWKGETERLVTQGVDREKAGKPGKTADRCRVRRLDPRDRQGLARFLPPPRGLRIETRRITRIVTDRVKSAGPRHSVHLS